MKTLEKKEVVIVAGGECLCANGPGKRPMAINDFSANAQTREVCIRKCCHEALSAFAVFVVWGGQQISC